jgi:hypothetical protein
LLVKLNYKICKTCQQELRSCYNFRKRCLEIFTLYSADDGDDDSSELDHDKITVDDPVESSEQVIFNANVTEELLVKIEDDIQEKNYIQWGDPVREDTYSEDDGDHEEFSVSQNKTFDCNQCHKTYQYRHQLVAHQSNHKNFRMFECSKEGALSSLFVTILF